MIRTDERKWYNLTLDNGTLESTIIQFKDIGVTAHRTQEVMENYAGEARVRGDSEVVDIIVNYLLAMHDPKANVIDGDAAPEEFMEIR